MHGPEKNREPRVVTLFAADAHVGAQRWPVRVRNVSPRGALIETEVTMPIGTSILLARDHVRASGTIVWKKANRFGVRFDDLIDIEKWDVSNNTSSAARDSETVTPQQKISDNEMMIRISQEVDFAARTMEGLGQTLISEPMLRVKHTHALQQLSITQASLSELAKIIRTGVNITTVEQSASGSLKSRLMR